MDSEIQELRREICRRMGKHDYDIHGDCQTCGHVFLLQQQGNDLVTA